MADNAALAQAMAALAQAINAFAANAAAGAVVAPPPHVPVTDLYSGNDAFDLSTRTGSHAFTAISKGLDEKWDGTVETFPMFVISLQERAQEGNWSAIDPFGIIVINTHNVLTHYHQITDAQITAARVARTDARAIQNTKAMYHCIKASITGDIRSNLFSQSIGNLPQFEDGPALFTSLTKFTSISSTQLSLIAFKNILNFDPSDYAFNIVTINTHLNHLFVIATTARRTLDPNERISHTLGVYDRIKQPTQWSTWVQQQIDRFDEGLLNNCQDFMSTAAIKQTTLTQRLGEFNGSLATVQQDIVAMVATLKKKTPTKVKATDPDSVEKGPPGKSKMPPFVRHFKSKSGDLYKVGDSKPFGDKTWYYCDCPRHRNRLKWHTFPAADCRTRAKWIADGSPTNPLRGLLAASDNDDSTPSTITDDSTASDSSTDVTALLSSTLSLTNGNEFAHELIADALNAIMEEQ